MKRIRLVALLLLTSMMVYGQKKFFAAKIYDAVFVTDSISRSKTPGSVLPAGQSIPQNFYAQHLGFFCKQELKMSKVRLPVTFRIGSVEQCNRLEQKPGYSDNPK